MTQSGDSERNLATIELPEKTYFKIGEVAKLLELEPYVLRYWETEFEVLSPEKTKSGQRVYQRDDIELLVQIQSLLYEEMFTIAGARRQLSRSREGKPSYFDIQDRSVPDRGSAMAGDEVLREELESTRRELTARETELEKIRTELERATDRIQEQDDEVERLRQIAAERAEALGQLKEDLEQRKASEQELRQQLEAARDKIEARPAVEDSTLVAQLRQQVAELDAQLQESQRESDRRRRALERTMRERRQQRRKVLDSVRNEVETLASIADGGVPANH